MSGATVTIGPSLCNPEALGTVAELRVALHRANEQALDMGERLHHNACVTERLTDELRRLLTLHLEQNPVGVYDLLTDLCKKYVRPMPQPGGSGLVH